MMKFELIAKSFFMDTIVHLCLIPVQRWKIRTSKDWERVPTVFCKSHSRVLICAKCVTY